MATSVWNQIESDPAKPAVLKARSVPMMRIDQAIKRWKVSTVKAARRLDTAPDRVRQLLEGDFNWFDLNALLELAQRTGLDPRVEVRIQSQS